MKDRYSTEKDGRPSWFDPSEAGGRFFSIGKMNLAALFLAAIALLYAFSYGRGLAGRIDSVQLNLDKNTKQLEEAGNKITKLQEALISTGTVRPEKSSSPEEVKDVQCMLMILGYYSNNVDGVPGIDLSEAVSRFRGEHNMTPGDDFKDGLFREALRNEVKSRSVAPRVHENGSGRRSVPNPSPGAGGSKLR